MLIARAPDDEGRRLKYAEKMASHGLLLKVVLVKTLEAMYMVTLMAKHTKKKKARLYLNLNTTKYFVNPKKCYWQKDSTK